MSFLMILSTVYVEKKTTINNFTHFKWIWKRRTVVWAFTYMEGEWEERERRNGGGRERAKRQGISTLFSGEALFGPLAHTRTHTQISNSHTHTCTEHQRLFKLLIKRLAPSSYALKLAEGVRVQEILAFLTHGLIGEPGSSSTYVILIQFLMVRLRWFERRAVWSDISVERGEGKRDRERWTES